MAKAAVPDQVQRPAIASLNHAVHLPVASGRGDFQQGVQQPAANAKNPKLRQNHQGEFRRAMLRNVFAVSQHLAVLTGRQHGDAIGLVDRVDAFQERQVRCFAMSEVALIEAFAIHRGKKATDSATVVRAGGAQLKLRRVDGPWLARAHGRSSATKSAAAWITVESSSTRRWPSPLVSSSRARGQVRR